MSGVQLSPELAAKVGAIRAWDASVVEWIGLEPDYVVSVRTEQRLGGLLVEWQVLDSKEPPKPSRGSWQGWVRVESHGEGDALFTGRVALEQTEADDLAAAVGPKPSLFTPEETIRMQSVGLPAEPIEVRTEWRVVGDPGPEYPPYSFTFESEDAARGFARLIDTSPSAGWRDGPHVERRQVTETPWRRDTFEESSTFRYNESAPAQPEG